MDGQSVVNDEKSPLNLDRFNTDKVEECIFDVINSDVGFEKTHTVFIYVLEFVDRKLNQFFISIGCDAVSFLIEVFNYASSDIEPLLKPGSQAFLRLKALYR